MRDIYGGNSRAAYNDTRRMLIAQPEKIMALFKACYKKIPNDAAHKNPGCHVWIATTGGDKLSLTSQNGKGTPRFGSGMLSPCKTANARAYIYQTHYKVTLPKHVRLRMKKNCHEYCVNPTHIIKPKAMK